MALRGPNGWIENPTTREVDKLAQVHVVRKVRSPYGSKMIAMNQDGWKDIAVKRREIGVDGFGVLAHLLTMLGYENVLPVSQKAIAEALGMQQQNVSRAMKRLVVAGVLIEGEKSGLYRSYRLNPEFGWKGSSESHHRAIRDHGKR